ncbi:MAG: outer-membrane lipoprotein carrier protein LolA [Bacteroidaceae bacterium]|nr:outer-membrane lipoprotein carrier protein LolA [Bacteroidaceae bacterium]
MKKLFLTLLSVLLPYCLSAQTDKAKVVLDKVVSTLTKDGGIQIDFEGTESGSITMKGEKFYLHSGQIQSWYDGKTQWSYVADTEEVNISHPTPEELQGINPYFILVNYQENFNSSYKGMKSHEGKQVQEIVLVPKGNANERITLWISKMNYPIYIKVENNGKPVSEINVKAIQKQEQITDHAFRFNKSLYPNAEIIDLR